MIGLEPTFLNNLEQARDFIADLPKARKGPVHPNDVPKIKGKFKNLKSCVEVVQRVGMQITDILSNQGACAEAQEVGAEVSSLNQVLANFRHDYDDVLSVTSSMYSGWQDNRRARSASVHSGVSHHTTDSEFERGKSRVKERNC